MTTTGRRKPRVKYKPQTFPCPTCQRPTILGYGLKCYGYHTEEEIRAGRGGKRGRK